MILRNHSNKLNYSNKSWLKSNNKEFKLQITELEAIVYGDHQLGKTSVHVVTCKELTLP